MDAGVDWTGFLLIFSSNIEKKMDSFFNWHVDFRKSLLKVRRTHVCMSYTIATYITDFLFLPAKGEFLWGFLLRVVRFLYIHPFEARCEIWQTFSSVWRFNFVVVFHCNGCMYREKRIIVSLRQLVLFVFICNRLFILPYSESGLKLYYSQGFSDLFSVT